MVGFLLNHESLPKCTRPEHQIIEKSIKIEKIEKNDILEGAYDGAYQIWSRADRWAPISRVKKNVTRYHTCEQIWTLFADSHSQGCRRILDILDFSEMCSTLKSCISELSEYFFKIRKVPERSMSELSYEPNNIKNGHLAQKIEPIENRQFSKNRFHTPTYTKPTSLAVHDQICS